MKFLGDDEELIGGERYPNFSLEQFLAEHDIAWKVYESGDHAEVSVNCPSCTERGEDTPDNKKKLWINQDKGTFYCYRCQWSGSFVRLVQKLTNSSFGNAIRILKGTSLDPMEHLNLKLIVEKAEVDGVDLELREVELPYGYEPIEGPQPYLEKRGIPWQYAARNEWGFSVAGFTKDRIVVPTFMEGKLVFWQARATWEEGDREEDEFKKVLNPKGVSARSVLYNYDKAREFKEIIITEGFVDAVKVGPDAVATNGKNIHPQQIEWLLKTEAKSVVLLWDLDAWTDEKQMKDKFKPSSIQKATELLRAYGLTVRAAKLNAGKDPGSFPYHCKTLRNIIDTAKEPVFK